MEVVIIALIVFVGAVVFTVWSEVQSVDKAMWQKDTEMRHKCQKLESDIVDLHRAIKELKDKLEEEEEEES